MNQIRARRVTSSCGIHRRTGFTLLELLIVIGIIVILASLVLAVSSSVARAADERSTRNTLEVLNMAVEEYERALDRRLNYRSNAVAGGIGADPAASLTRKYDVESDPGVPPPGSGVANWGSLVAPYGAAGVAGPQPPFRRTAILIQAMSDSPTCAAMLQKLPENVFRGIKANTAQGNFTAVRHCLDSWDNPIIAVFPGRDATQAELTANNASIVDRDGTVSCDSERTAGPFVACKDRRVLFVSAGADSKFAQSSTASNDNLYSYDPIFR